MVKPLTEQPQLAGLARQERAPSTTRARHGHKAHGAGDSANTVSSLADDFAAATIAAPLHTSVGTQQALPSAPTAAGVSTARSIGHTAPQGQNPGSQQLTKDYTKALTSPSEGDKTAFLDHYNATYAPRLKTEDAAMQQLAQHLAYMHLPKGSTVAFNVKHDLDGVQEPSYPHQAVIRDTIMDSREQGVKAHVLWPKDEQNTKHNRVVIAFKGTGSYDKYSINNKEASGLTADLDGRGIGHAGFRNMEDEVLKHVHTALLQNRPVTITGHSLGGACAARLMSMLDPVDQSAVKLITFGAPHLDREAAAKIKSGNPNIRCFQTKGDPIPSAGESPIAARYFQTQSKAWSPVAKHGDMSLVRHDLDDPNAKLQKYAKEGEGSFTKPSTLVESGRRYFGWNNGSAK